MHYILKILRTSSKLRPLCRKWVTNLQHWKPSIHLSMQRTYPKKSSRNIWIWRCIIRNIWDWHILSTLIRQSNHQNFLIRYKTKFRTGRIGQKTPFIWMICSVTRTHKHWERKWMKLNVKFKTSMTKPFRTLTLIMWFCLTSWRTWIIFCIWTATSTSSRIWRWRWLILLTKWSKDSKTIS